MAPVIGVGGVTNFLHNSYRKKVKMERAVGKSLLFSEILRGRMFRKGGGGQFFLICRSLGQRRRKLN